MKHTALLLIDIQNIYFEEGDYQLFQPEMAAENVKWILEEWRQRELPVIHVRHCFKTEEEAARNQYLNEIHDAVSPIEGEKVITKYFPNAFLQTDLRETLMQLGVKSLVVVGMMSNMCVDTTVRACQTHGIQVTLLQDACAAKELVFQHEKLPGDLVHKVFMSAMQGKFAKVMDTKNFISQM